ncbi:hypothetical protein EDD22DRAFT_954314 [Suillus occidentalis]|nr:hypothetical protein EDD22DRAFT_954314 [Suillus occidentalis]
MDEDDCPPVSAEFPESPPAAFVKSLDLGDARTWSRLFVTDPETTSVNLVSLWDDERGIMVLRKYYALRDEAEDTSPFWYASRVLEDSMQNYGPLLPYSRPRRMHSRACAPPEVKKGDRTLKEYVLSVCHISLPLPPPPPPPVFFYPLMWGARHMHIEYGIASSLSHYFLTFSVSSKFRAFLVVPEYAEDSFRHICLQTLAEMGRRYARTVLPKPIPTSERQEEEADKDLKLLLTCTEPLFMNKNPDVVPLAVARAFYYLSPLSMLSKIGAPRLRLLSVSHEVERVALAYLLVVAWKRYKPPIYVTENGFAIKDDSEHSKSIEEALQDNDRVNYLKSITAYLKDAVLEHGVDVRAYLPWRYV